MELENRPRRLPFLRPRRPRKRRGTLPCPGANSVLRRQYRRHGRARWRILIERGHGLAFVRRERGDVRQPCNLWMVPGFSDHRSSYEWPTRIVGPSCAARIRLVTATSSSNDIVGFWPLQQGRTGVDGQDFADIETYGVERWLGGACAPGGEGEPRQDNRTLGLDARLSRARQTARLTFPNPDLEIEKRNGVPAPASR